MNRQEVMQYLDEMDLEFPEEINGATLSIKHSPCLGHVTLVKRKSVNGFYWVARDYVLYENMETYVLEQIINLKENEQ